MIRSHALRAALVRTLSLTVASAVALTSTGAHAQDATPTPEPAKATEPPEPARATQTVAPPDDPSRTKTLEPKPSEPPVAGRTTFDVDPIADGAIILVSLGSAGLLNAINGTGEIRPQQISPTFDRSSLLGIDRGALSQHIDPNASLASNLGLAAVALYAVADPFLSAYREKNAQSGLTDGLMYAETFALTFAMTNMVKIAVRRPRPSAYLAAEQHRNDPTYSNADTDSALSFFSVHASMTTALGATATYLAFARSPNSARPWITLAVATALSAFVSIERVRAGNHFPTDVIAGAVAGAGIGVLVPHLHRTDDIKQRRVWVGFSPSERGNGGTAMLSGLF